MGELVEANFKKTPEATTRSTSVTQRRRFLGTKPGKIATIVTAVGISAQLGIAAKEGKFGSTAENIANVPTVLTEPFKVSVEKENELLKIGKGSIKIMKDSHLNVREEPKIPYSSETPNNIDWKDIREINGVDIAQADVFTVENPIILQGHNPSNGYWVKLGEKIYVNIDQTFPYVRKSEDFKITEAQENEQGQLVTAGLTPDKIGVIKIPPKDK